MITKEEVEHVGWLARIRIDETKSDAYAGKLNSVLDYFGQLDKVDTEDVPPTYHVMDIVNVFRKDEVTESMPQDAVLSNTEYRKEGNFKTPKII
ncbi:MAG: Asp-tRNA(Asn)/Glu-tRNA(Gln) amidotransferase subunit GatC [Methanosarcinaceae archaeon]|nr:Asp-tRNA(Asn)/Glu-tRNA(Gln) amidotransferase subunit GatC [Methanosarcinaceae archaeon]